MAGWWKETERSRTCKRLITKPMKSGPVPNQKVTVDFQLGEKRLRQESERNQSPWLQTVTESVHRAGEVLWVTSASALTRGTDVCSDTGTGETAPGEGAPGSCRRP